MKLKLVRLDMTDQGLFGHLEAPGFECVTLERHDIHIPTGTYKITLYDSPTFKRTVLLLHDVPGRSDIEIHAGNWEHNSKGCVLVGEKRVGFSIENSRVTLDKLISLVKGHDDVTITII